MTVAEWLAAHPYLQPVAELRARVDAALATVPIPAAPIPDWTSYADEFHAGVPLLMSARAAVDLAPVDAALDELLAMFSSTPLASRHDEDGWRRLLRWAIVARYLRDVRPAFDRWRDEDRWMRNLCPTCGSGPAMGQLAGTDPGRLRLMSCGCCQTLWRYRRTSCPFCESRDDHRLAVLDVAGEGGLRLDYCTSCLGYLKTYNGTGNEAVLLADWTSLHLDVLARDRGLKRLATSAYGI